MENKNEFLKEEYFHLQNLVEKFDDKALTIKSWSITISLVGISTGFVEKNSALFLISAGSAVLFWLLEGLWKNYQVAYYKRINEIEEHFKIKKVLKISTSWRSSRYKNSICKIWKSEGKIDSKQFRAWKIFFWVHVLLPHLIIFLAGFVLFFVDFYFNIIE